MCGIAGFVDPRGRIVDAPALLRKMGDSIRHRGPDGNGEWFDADARVGFSHRRLAIIDLTSEGAQPMMSACGRYVLSYNGEIYNFAELRTLLESERAGVAWRGHSDTEVLLEAFSAWGLTRTLEAANGMFAFSLWDREERVLTLARDRFGEKPLYYGWVGDVFAFASELRPLELLPGFKRDVDPDALGLLLQFNYIPAPFSIYRGIQKLEPGSSIAWRVDSPQRLESTRYFDALQVAADGQARRLTADDREIVPIVESALRRAVKLRMAADVPLGAFLSGGIDSSTVVGLMQSQSADPVRTFSIAFEEQGFNEAPFARAVAAHLGTNHTEFTVSPADALAVIPRLGTIYDEPFADASQIPTFLVSSLARKDVVVSLSGDGGDELFGGYDRYLGTPRLWANLSRVPHFLRSGASAAIGAVPDGVWRSVGRTRAWTRRGVEPALDQRLAHQRAMLAARTAARLFQLQSSFWHEPVRVVPQFSRPRPLMLADSKWPNGLAIAEQMMAVDTVTYLPDDILAKVDRASMAVSLEARVPLLDPDVYGLLWRLPPRQRIRGSTGKWILRQVLSRYVPDHLFDRPKHGFAVPVADWLRGPLRDWGESLLTPASLARSGLFDSKKIRAIWNAHLRNVGNGWVDRLWSVLIFQSWYLQRH